MPECSGNGRTGNTSNYVKVKALDVNMNEQIYEGEGLLARAFCHEIDHLDGKMYTELVEENFTR